MHDIRGITQMWAIFEGGPPALTGGPPRGCGPVAQRIERSYAEVRGCGFRIPSGPQCAKYQRGNNRVDSAVNICF